MSIVDAVIAPESSASLAVRTPAALTLNFGAADPPNIMVLLSRSIWVPADAPQSEDWSFPPMMVASGKLSIVTSIGIALEFTPSWSCPATRSQSIWPIKVKLRSMSVASNGTPFTDLKTRGRTSCQAMEISYQRSISSQVIVMPVFPSAFPHVAVYV